MRFTLVLLSALVAVAFAADSDTVFTPSYYPNTPAVVDTNPNLRIVGGRNALRNQIPYQVSLQRRLIISSSHICGGSIIHPSWILTAAHCTQSAASTLSVVAGILLLNDNGIAGQQTRQVERIINHPNYPGGSQVAPDDISLLLLAQPLIVNLVNVQIIPIPPQGAVHTGTARLSGWGLTQTGGSVPNNLQVADLPIVPALECGARLDGFLGAARNPFSRDLNVCSGTGATGRESACNGDSGGPLVNNGQVFGIVSWGLVPCGNAGAPSVYARTSAYTNWIVQNTNGAVQPLLA